MNTTEQMPAGEIDSAEAEVRSHPDDFAAYQALGFAYFQAERYIDARVALEQALVLNPHAAAAHEKIGHIHYRIDSPQDETSTAYERSIAIDPHYTSAYFGLAILHLSKTRDLRQAVAALERGLHNNPGDPFLTSQLGAFEARLAHTHKALEILEHAALEHPDDPHAYDWLSYLYLRLNRLADAQTAARRVIALKGRDHSPHRVLGFILHLLGRDAEALTELEQAVALEPLDYEARAGLAKLYTRLGNLPAAEGQHKTGLAMAWDEDREYGLACFYAVLGEADRALDLLEKEGVLRQVSAGWLHIDPELVFIQENGRFKKLLQ